MPEEFDPEWEYWEPDPEVAEVVYARRATGIQLFGRDSPDGTPGFGVCDRRGYRRTWWREMRSIGGADAGHARCGHCREWFRRRTERSRYCSLACYHSRVTPPRVVVCPCGTTFSTRGYRKYCSSGCRPLPVVCRRVLPDTIPCPRCGGAFRPRNSRTKYCSHACGVSGNGGHNKLPAKPCRWCDRLFVPKRSVRVFCSHRCRAFSCHRGNPCS